MNLIKKWLEEIFGARMPKSATHFFTAHGFGCFDGGLLKGLRLVRLTDADLQALKAKGLMGARGWSLR